MRNKFIGAMYIGNKKIYRMMVGPKDYTPYCFHYHDTEEEAGECPYANEFFDLNKGAPFPVDEKAKKK